MEETKTRLMRAIRQIFNKGDRDEASYKHVLFGLAALRDKGSSREREDYYSPGYGVTEDDVQEYWTTITDIFNEVGLEKFELMLEGTDYDSKVW